MKGLPGDMGYHTERFPGIEEPHMLENAMLEMDYQVIKTLEHILPNGKKLVQIDIGK